MDTQNNYNQSAQFDIKVYTGLLKDLSNDLKEINNHQKFLHFCRETTKVFIELGGILKKAFEDINVKCDIINNNYNMHKEIHSGLIPFILIEKGMEIHTLNGENGDYLIGTGNDKYKKYESTARTVLRLMWFLDFVYHMMDGLITDKGKGLGSVCQNAYNIALYPNHPYHVIAAVKAGLLMAPGRDKLFEILFKDSKYPQAYESLAIIRMNIELLRSRLWQLYKDEGLTTLP